MSFLNVMRNGIYLFPDSLNTTIHRICSKFKKYYTRKTKPEKLKELVKLSLMTFKNPIPYIKRRKERHLISKRCWVCNDAAFYYHHIIQLMNGGLDVPVNRIPICHKCHCLIHPHLNKDESVITDDMKKYAISRAKRKNIFPMPEKDSTVNVPIVRSIKQRSKISRKFSCEQRYHNKAQRKYVYSLPK